MSVRIELLPLLLAIALASFACRVGGFWLMRFVTVTPRIDSALRGAPIAVMAGIVGPAAFRGSLPEWIGLAAVALATRFTRNELGAAVVGVAAVAMARWVLPA